MISLVIASIAWALRETVGARYLAALMAMVRLWALMDTLEAASTDLHIKIAWFSA